ncbi:sialate O-acetylesterase [Desulfovibrio sp. TomC]|uniref:sialate O-acetylesterase n=1 Tax=Desulfovibrio sp. TomC TaxID=1562888 RepID=UPI001E3C85B3|nr:sialate O-acetylesterase [Desulfovibrio sp. TomC]
MLTLYAHRGSRLTLGVAGLAALALLLLQPSAPGVAASQVLSPDAIQARYAGRAPVLPETGELAVFPGPAGEPAGDCAALAGGRTMVALVFGQSNASNTVDPGYDSRQPVYAFFGGSCQKAHDALPGATGAKGSSWPRLGDRVVSSGLYDTVIFADIARGGSSILNWGPGGTLNPLLLNTLDDLIAQGLPPTHILFHQGEADCALGLDAPDYRAMLEAVVSQIRQRVGEENDIIVARASLYLDPVCSEHSDPACYRSCPTLTAAQTEVANPARRIFSGPNTDLLVPWFDRNDGYHFTAKAADRFAAAWMPLLARGDSPVSAAQ